MQKFALFADTKEIDVEEHLVLFSAESATRRMASISMVLFIKC